MGQANFNLRALSPRTGQAADRGKNKNPGGASENGQREKIQEGLGNIKGFTEDW
jgi:hypothetical protein